MHRLLFSALLLAGAGAHAQEVTLTPGHPDLALDQLTASDATVEVRMVDPQQQSLGFSTETATLDGDVLVVVSSADVPMAGGALRDSTRMTWPGLAPISQTSRAGDDAGSATFADGTIAGSFGSADAAFPFEFARAEPVFPLAALPYVVRALPLDQTGYEALVPVFSPSSRFKEAILTVAGPETITLDDGTTVEAVAVDQAGGAGMTGGVAQRHYVHPDTRELLRTDLSPPGMTVHLVPLSDEAATAAMAAADAAAAAQEAAQEAAAENQLMPGSDALVAAPEQSVTFAVRLVQPMQQDLGTITTVETIADGQLTTISDVQIPQAGQNQQDTTVAAYPSLAPISRVEVTPGKTERATFADGQMTGTVVEGGESTDVEADLGGAFGPGITRHLVRSLPLAEGYAASFDQINGDGEISTSFVTVTGQDTVTRADGTESTVWIVVETEEDAPDYTYAVDVETRELLRMTFEPQPGALLEIVAQ